MADNEYLNWTIPAERYNDLTTADISQFEENLKKSFEYYIRESFDAGGFYMTPEGDDPNFMPQNISELAAGLDKDPRYERARTWLSKNIENKSYTGDEIRDALGTKSIGEQGSIASKLAEEFYTEKREAEARNQEGLDQSLGESEQEDPDAIETDLEELDKMDEEEAAMAQAREKAKEEAKQIVSQVDDLQVNFFNETTFVQSSLINIIDLKLNVVDFYEPKAYPYVGGSPNACIMVTGDPFNFLNRLGIYPNHDTYTNIPSSEIASLQPKLRFFKTIRDPDTKKEINIPIHFETALSGESLESLLQNRNRRAVGAGIKSFSLDYTGVDTFSLHKSFDAKLVVYAASIGELFKPRVDSKTGNLYSYIDLALRTNGVDGYGEDGTKVESNIARSIKEYKTDTSRLDFQIKAQIGMAELTAVSAANSAYANSLSQNSINLVMLPVKHSFKFLAQNGAVEMTIEYAPYVETRFAGSDFNVLSDREYLKFKINSECEALSDGLACTGEEEIIKTRINEEKQLTQNAAADLIRELAAANKIRYLPIDSTVAQEWLEKGPSLDWGKLTKLAPYAAFVGKEGNQEALKEDIAKSATDESKEYRGPLKSSFTTPLTTAARFVYLCDLTDILLAKMTKNNSVNHVQAVTEQLKSEKPKVSDFSKSHPDLIESIVDRFAQSGEDFSKTRVVFGPIEIIDGANPQQNVRIISIGDLPIPIPLLLEYMIEKAASKARNHFDFQTFIKDLVTHTLNNWLNNDIPYDGLCNQNVRIDSTNIMALDSQFGRDDLTEKLVTMNTRLERATPSRVVKKAGAPAVGNAQSIFAHRLHLDDLPQPALETAAAKPLDVTDPREETSYLVFYSTPACPVRSEFGDPLSDAVQGVHHYTLAKDRGIVKDIQLEVAKDAGELKALRIAAAGSGPFAQLHEIYNVNIKTYANLNIWPGTTIYVDPRGWAPDIDAGTLELYGVRSFEELGLGGYYNVIKVGHVFERGVFETRIHAMIFATADGKPPDSNTSLQTPSEAPLKKCGAEEGTSGEGPATPVSPCHGGSAARLQALNGGYGVQELARTLLIDEGEYGEHPPPSSNPWTT